MTGEGTLVNEILDWCRTKGMSPAEAVEYLSFAIGIELALNVVDDEEDLRKSLIDIADTIERTAHHTYENRDKATVKDH